MHKGTFLRGAFTGYRLSLGMLCSLHLTLRRKADKVQRSSCTSFSQPSVYMLQQNMMCEMGEM